MVAEVAAATVGDVTGSEGLTASRFAVEVEGRARAGRGRRLGRDGCDAPNAWVVPAKRSRTARAFGARPPGLVRSEAGSPIGRSVRRTGV